MPDGPGLDIDTPAQGLNRFPVRFHDGLDVGCQYGGQGLRGGSGDDHLDGGFNPGVDGLDVDTCVGGGGTDAAANCEKVVSVP